MKSLLVLWLVIGIAATGWGLTWQDQDENRLQYSYSLLPSANARSVSSSLTLFYQVNDRSSIGLSYLSFDNAFLLSSNYTVGYQLKYGLEQWRGLWPTALIGY